MIRIQHQPLIEFASQLLRRGGMVDDEPDVVARSLVDSNLRGYDSHGVMRIPSYIDLIVNGVLKPGVELKINRVTDSIVIADGQWGIGQVQATKLLHRLMDKCDSHGMAVGSVIQCGHIGRLGEYCEVAAARGFVSLLTVNSHGAVVRMSPPGGAAPRLSTNPLAFGAPHENTPIVADFSTSATAEGKVRVKRIAGDPVPAGWLIDSKGNPTTDPNDLYGDPPGSILPMGGDQAYKGFALGLMVEILSGALSGGVTARPEAYPRLGNCVFMLLLNPAQFGGAQHFAEEVRQLVAYIRSCPTAPGHDRIILPGDPERDRHQVLIRDGIAFDAGNWDKLVEIAVRFDVELPEV